ncbi:MAG: hypothetical protein L3J15_02325 [Devosiaceae bacterium]|nr:hypothetical protein [Devosiaceae bacterium]
MIILTPSQMVFERMNELQEECKSKFRESIFPIYGAKEDGTPSHIGTCILFEKDCKKYLLTAAHVIDWNDITTIYISCSEFIKIESIFGASPKIEGSRVKDKLDFAIAELPDDFISELGNVEFIKFEYINTKSTQVEGHYYVCMGFPNSRNKKFNPSTSSVKSQLASFGSNSVSFSKSKMNHSYLAGKHFLIEREKHSSNEQGQKISSFGFNGMSGGMLVDAGDLSDPKYVAGVSKNNLKLVGLITEYHKDEQTIVATNLGEVMDSYFARKSG